MRRSAPPPRMVLLVLALGSLAVVLPMALRHVRLFAAAHLAAPIAPSGNPGNRKYPALAVNRSGDILLAWAEGAGWNQGGAVAWQRFNPHGSPIGPEGRAPGLPAWDFVAAFARSDGRFIVMF